MQPVLGYWVVDLNATLEENPFLLADAREAVRHDLTDSPFELHITKHDYVSRSKELTRADHYAVESIDGDYMTLALTAAEGIDAKANRKTVLRVKDGKLLIGLPSRGLVVVMSRPSAGASQP